MKAFLFYSKVENLFMQDIVLFMIDFFAIFSSKQNEDCFFLRILPIFDNSGELKVFIPQNKVEGFFQHHLYLSDSFASFNQS